MPTQTQYGVQNINGDAILHDQTLLTSEPPMKQIVQIACRDGYGTIQSVGDRTS